MRHGQVGASVPGLDLGAVRQGGGDAADGGHAVLPAVTIRSVGEGGSMWARLLLSAAGLCSTMGRGSNLTRL